MNALVCCMLITKLFHLLQLPVYLFSDSKDWKTVIFYSHYLIFLFFRPQIFDVSEAVFFETLPYDMVCSEIMSYGVFVLCRDENANFCQLADPKSTLWDPPCHNNEREIWKSKTIVNLWLGLDVHTKYGGFSPPMAEIVPLGHGVGQINVQINITSAVWQLATWVFDSRCGFSDLSNEDIAMVRTAPRGQLSSWASAHILVEIWLNALN